MMTEFNRASYYHYSFDVGLSERDWGDGDDEEVTVMFRFWRLNQNNPATASVTLLQAGEYQINLCGLSNGDANEVTSDLRDCLTWIGVSQASHAELVATLLEDIENGFLNNGSVLDLRCWPRQNVIMDIVEAWSPAEHLVLENAVRLAIGMEVVGQETVWLKWWNTVEIGVPEPSLLNDDRFVERVEYIRFGRSLAMLERRLYVQDDLDVVMGESMEVYTVKTVPASEEVIGRLEKVLDGEKVSCVICNEEDEGEEQHELTRMPCKHVFHTKCIETWVRISSTCPLCRFVLS